MRIIGYLEFPGVKTTVFQMDNRISIKFETGLYEQTFKFRTGEGINNIEDVQRLVQPAFVEEVLKGFHRMHQIRTNILSNHQNTLSKPDYFEEII